MATKSTKDKPASKPAGNLGISEDEYYGDGCCPSMPSGKDREQRFIYPNFDLKEKQLAKVPDLDGVEQDSTVTMTVKCRISAISSDETDQGERKRVSLEIQDISNVSVAESEADTEDDAEEEDDTESDMPEAVETDKKPKRLTPKDAGISYRKR